MARNSKSLAFSYVNHDTSNKNFLHKSFDKVKCYHSNFYKSKFTNVSFRGASFKWCSFTCAAFNNCSFKGTKFKGGSTAKSTFEQCVFNSVVLEKSTFSASTFTDCYFVNCKKMLSTIPPNNLHNCKIHDSLPPESMFSDELLDVVRSLRNNKYVLKSSILHIKRQKLDTLNLYRLVEKYGEVFLTQYLVIACRNINNDFYNISYVERLLDKVIISEPGLTTGGNL